VAAALWPWNATWREICGPRRHKYLAKPRHEAILAIAVAFPEWSYPRIGRLFNRDHSTILKSLDAFAKRIAHGEVQLLPRAKVLPTKIRMQKSPVSTKRDLTIFKRYTAGASADAIAEALHMTERDVYRALMRVRQLTAAAQSLQKSEV
jgi:DNA-binding CsgD family transcriptional regulator